MQARPSILLLNSYTLQPLAPEADPEQYRSAIEEAKFLRGEASLLGVNCVATDAILRVGDGYTVSTVVTPEVRC